MQCLKLLWKDDSGQDLIEYALLIGLVALVAIVGFPPLSAAIKAIFTSTTTCLQNPTGCGQ